MTADFVAEPFEVIVTHRSDVAVLSIRGDVDLVTAPLLTESIDVVLSETQPAGLIIDLTDVPFLASMGMNVLVDASRRIGAAAAFAVVADGPSTARPLTLLGLGEKFSICTDMDAAFSAVTQ